MGGIIHVVQLQFQSDVGSEKIDDVLAQLIALKDKCVLLDTQKPYIKSIRAGADNSIEGMQNGYTHMIITEFETVAHRDYYAKGDPAHMLLATSLPPFVKGLQVLDIAA
ncbi:hypothetical protein V498_06286 [Pseudogymnoascus sp. VKM F-4517 (FW-2822)]|nr:hypothetical protein V498_06286 [Pseudogymnoascus sp. VKM F-4517 (FW-2822)]